MTLFDRVKQRLLPTQQADQFYQSCKDGLYTIEKALTQLKGTTPKLQGSISLGVVPHFFSKNLNSLIQRFLQANPQTKIKINTASPTELWQMVQNGEIDFSLMDSSFLPGTNRQKIVTKSKFLIVGGHQLIQNLNLSSLDKKNMLEIPFIEMTNDEGFLKKLLQYYFKTPGIRPQVIAEVPDWTTMLDLCLSGVGLAIIPEDIVSSVDKSLFSVIPINSSKVSELNCFEISYVISHLVERSLPLAAQEFMNQLSNENNNIRPEEKSSFAATIELNQ